MVRPSPSLYTNPIFILCVCVQVSWSMEHKLARSGTYEVKFFDEESYSILRKVRSPEVEALKGEA